MWKHRKVLLVPGLLIGATHLCDDVPVTLLACSARIAANKVQGVALWR
jgi:hypothetical protein